MKQYRWIFIGAGLLILLFLLWFFQKLVLYIVLAMVLSLIGRPLIKALRWIKIGKWQIPKGICAGIALMMIYGLISLFMFIFVPILAEQVQNLSKLDVKKMVLSVEKPLLSVKKEAVKYHFLKKGQTFWDYGQDELTKFLSEFEISNLLSGLVGFTGDLVILLFAVTFITFFFMKEDRMIYNIVMQLTPPGYEDKITNIMVHSKKLLTRYFLGLIIEETIVGTLVGLGMKFMGVENALLIGFIAGLVNVIPYVGPIIGLLFGMLMIIISNMNLDFYAFTLPLLAKAFILFNLIHVIDNALMQPFIYSSSVKAHPLEIFILILAAGMALGIPGLLLAIPVYTLIRVIAKEFLGQFKIIQNITGGIY